MMLSGIIDAPPQQLLANTIDTLPPQIMTPFLGIHLLRVRQVRRPLDLVFFTHIFHA